MCLPSDSLEVIVQNSRNQDRGTREASTRALWTTRSLLSLRARFFPSLAALPTVGCPVYVDAPCGDLSPCRPFPRPHRRGCGRSSFHMLTTVARRFLPVRPSRNVSHGAALHHQGELYLISR